MPAEAFEPEQDVTYSSKRDKLHMIHRKVDSLARKNGTPIETAPAKENQPYGRVEKSNASAIDGIPEFRLVVAPKPKPVPKKAPAKKKAAPKPKPKPAPKKAPAKKKAAPKKPALPRDYKGDVHFVVDLEGIGPVYEKKLHEAKIFNTQELLFTGDKRLQNVTGAPAKVIKNWKDMCQLVKIKGIGPQFAELMVRAGIGGIEELKKLDPAAAVAQIKEYEAGLKSRVTGSGIGLKRLTAWQNTAKPMRKVAIDLKKIEVIELESRQAIAAKGDQKLKPARGKAATSTKKSFPESLEKKAPAKSKPASKAAAKAATCGAKTKAGKACQNSPAGRSKYCASHKGYRA